MYIHRCQNATRPPAKICKKLGTFVHPSLLEFINSIIKGQHCVGTFSPLPPGMPAAPLSPGSPPGPDAPAVPGAPTTPGSPLNQTHVKSIISVTKEENEVSHS
jgi:hypothetical protein